MQKITAFDIVMINIVSIVSLKNVPITSQCGFSIIFIYCVVSALFFIPGAVAVAELGTRFPQSGGISAWVNKAFGIKISSCVVFTQWMYNIIFFPTLAVFATSQLSYFISHILGVDVEFFTENKIYVTLSALSIFWLGVLINSYGIIISSRMSSISAIFGVILPIILIILLSVVWVFFDYETKSTSQSFFNSNSNLALITIVFFSLVGIEVTAAHADKIENARNNFPKALYITVCIVPIVMILVNTLVYMVLPSSLISDRLGLIETFGVFSHKFNLNHMQYIVALMIAAGSFGCLSSWMITLSKYFLKISEYGSFPKVFIKKNKNDVPVNILVIQGIIYSALCLIYLWMPSIKDAYLFLSAFSAQLALLANAVFFMAAIKLRMNYKWQEAYQISKNKYFSITLYLLGASSCFVAIMLGFLIIDIYVYYNSICYLIVAGVLAVISSKLLFKLLR